MSGKRKIFTPEFKAKVALEAIRGFKPISELAKEFQIHPHVISNWKKQLLENLPSVFDSKRGPKSIENNDLTDSLYQQIGKLQVEVEYLKKKFNSIS